MSARRLLLTRQADDNERWAALIQQCHQAIQTLSWPALTIHPLSLNTDSYQQIDWLLVTSRHAVENARKLLLGTPARHYLVVGERTAAALESLLQIPVQRAVPASSEGILSALSQATERGRILLLKGQGGRRLLVETLQKRALPLIVANVYRRSPNILTPPQADAVHQFRPTHVLATSCESLDSFSSAMRKTRRVTSTWYRRLRVVASSARIADYARRIGYANVESMGAATDAALLDWLVGESPSGHNQINSAGPE